MYVPAAATDEDVDQRIVEAAARLTADGAVTGWAALRWCGVPYVDGLDSDGRAPLPVPLALGRGRGRAPAGAMATRAALGVDDVAVVDGLRVTAPLRALVDQARWCDDPRELVVLLDQTRGAGLVTRVELARDPVGRRASPAQGRLRSVLALSSARSRSPQETRLRLVCRLDLGIERLLENATILDPAGRFVAEVDLLDPDHGVALEYDGSVHRSAARHASDVARSESLLDVGLEVVSVVGRAGLDPVVLGRRLASARRRAQRLVPRFRAVIRPL
ncbi:hypothetical protein K8Z61_05350 [Nocardioides sp. TRM66260-LWL]|uniref:hypothetical protein n=1 Tax=Nocardioides sp. TRM66260-LWL TaxID=2874478 RepID=UPI001CC55DF1|nr:hypothetical protein [Nocardioides sp. TRM66260-LWL]MBZ5733915.1 hypothetical protein [Nocardioides sp. TRM66260-LWL]